VHKNRKTRPWVEDEQGHPAAYANNSEKVKKGGSFQRLGTENRKQGEMTLRRLPGESRRGGRLEGRDKRGGGGESRTSFFRRHLGEEGGGTSYRSESFTCESTLVELADWASWVGSGSEGERAGGRRVWRAGGKKKGV